MRRQRVDQDSTYDGRYKHKGTRVCTTILPIRRQRDPQEDGDDCADYNERKVHCMSVEKLTLYHAVDTTEESGLDGGKSEKVQD